MRIGVTEVGRNRLDDRLKVVTDEALEPLLIGPALGQARHRMHQEGSALEWQRVAQDFGDGVLEVLRVGLHFAVP